MYQAIRHKRSRVVTGGFYSFLPPTFDKGMLSTKILRYVMHYKQFCLWLRTFCFTEFLDLGAKNQIMMKCNSSRLYFAYSKLVTVTVFFFILRAIEGEVRRNLAVPSPVDALRHRCSDSTTSYTGLGANDVTGTS